MIALADHLSPGPLRRSHVLRRLYRLHKTLNPCPLLVCLPSAIPAHRRIHSLSHSRRLDDRGHHRRDQTLQSNSQIMGSNDGRHLHQLLRILLWLSDTERPDGFCDTFPSSQGCMGSANADAADHTIIGGAFPGCIDLRIRHYQIGCPSQTQKRWKCKTSALVPI